MSLWSEHDDSIAYPRNERELETVISESLLDLAFQEGHVPPDELQINAVEARYTSMLDDAVTKLQRLQRPRSEWQPHEKPGPILKSAIASATQALAATRRLDRMEWGVGETESDDEDGDYE